MYFRMQLQNVTNMDGESSKHIKLDDSLLHDEHLNLNLHSLSLKDVREFTNDFSDENLLGEGGFGTVYKALLPNGNIIAVKKLITSTKPGLQDKQYDNEVRNLMRLIHPNIVQLVGYCSETEKYPILHNGKYVYAEKSEMLLFLEYMPKGSLRDHISDASSGLDWNTRYNIIVGICHGLHYLHEEWQPSTPIIHRDLKPANILLDDNMMPKITDFGLSRLFGEEQTRIITKQFRGTLGYMAPEYLNRGIITKGLDIFSLGVIIIQVVTGEKHYPYKEDEASSQEFMELVLKEWRNRLEKVPGYTSKAFACQQIRRCIEIGLLCLKFDRAERPTTRQIMEMLAKKDTECSNVRKEAARLLSRKNRESARRSRLRKQQRLGELEQEVARLQTDNARVAARAAAIASDYTHMEQENTVLRGRAGELGDRLRSVNEVLRVVEEFSGVAMDIQEEMPADDPLLRPWQLPNPAAAVPIGGAHMLQY